GLAVVLAAEPVDLLLRPVGRELGTTVYRDPVVEVRRGNEDGDARIALEVPRLRPSVGGVEGHGVAVALHPDDGALRRAVGTKCRADAEVRLVEERELAFGEHVV